MSITRLDQHAARDLFVFEACDRFRPARAQHPQVLFRFQNFQGGGFIIRSDDHFSKNFGDRARRVFVDRCVESDNASER